MAQKSVDGMVHRMEKRMASMGNYLVEKTVDLTAVSLAVSLAVSSAVSSVASTVASTAVASVGYSVVLMAETKVEPTAALDLLWVVQSVPLSEY